MACTLGKNSCPSLKNTMRQRHRIHTSKGFEYDAVASVECDAGKVIESRESRPDQRIKVADGLTPVEMTFVIPGPCCPL
jgi:hypothetical protein